MRYQYLFAAVTALLLQASTQGQINVDNDPSLTIDKRARMPKHLTDDEETYPIKTTIQKLYNDVIGGRPALVIFWGVKMANATSINLRHAEQIRSSLQQQIDIYYAYVGDPANFDKNAAILREAMKKDASIKYETAPFYIVHTNDKMIASEEVVNLFEIDMQPLKLGWPVSVLIDGSSKRLWQTDFTSDSLMAEVNLLTRLSQEEERKNWVKRGSYQPVETASVLQSLLGQPFPDAEDLLKSRRYINKGMYAEKAEIFKTAGGVSYFQFDCGCGNDDPDVLLGIKEDKVVYAAFTASPDKMKPLFDELKSKGFVQKSMDKKAEMEEWRRFYWTSINKEERIFADAILFLGTFDNPLLVEVLAKGVAHRWDDQLK